MIKKNSLPLFTCSLPFPFFLYPVAQGMYQSPKYSQSAYLTAQLRRRWSTGAHKSSSNYSIMHSVSTCKQDATVELSVLLTYFLFSTFKIKGRKRRNHHLRQRGGSAVTARCIENIRCYTSSLSFFPTIIVGKSVQLVGCVWLYAKGHTQCCVLNSFTCNSSQCDTNVVGDGQQTEMTMVPATFTKHLVTITANMTADATSTQQ